MSSASTRRPSCRRPPSRRSAGRRAWSAIARRLRHGEPDSPWPAAIDAFAKDGGRQSLQDLLDSHTTTHGLQHKLADGVDDLASLKVELQHRSGLTDFRALLIGHFANHSDVIKIDRAVQDIKQLARTLRRDPGAPLRPRERIALDDATRSIGRLELEEHAVRELPVLRDLYAGRLRLSRTDAADLLRVTGEYGLEPHERLDRPAVATRAELIATARDRAGHWAQLAEDPLHGQVDPADHIDPADPIDPVDPARTRQAAEVIRRSYDVLIATLTEWAGPAG